MILVMASQGSRSPWAVDQTLTAKLNLKRTTSKEAGPHERWPKTLNLNLEYDFRHSRDLLKQAEWQLKKDSPYSFSGDVEEVRCWRWCWWWGEHNCAVTNPCNSKTEYRRTFCLNSVFIVLPLYQPVRSGRGQEMDSQHDTYRLSQLDLQLLTGPTCNEVGLQLFCVWGRLIKPILYLMAIQY
jgi:hypothetical protein